MEDYQSWPVFTKTIFLLFSKKEINLSPQAFACCSEQRFESVLRCFRKLKRTNQTPSQRTSQQTMNNYCHWKGPRPVCRTQKTPFPLSSDSKASLSSDFGTNSNSCASKSRRLSTTSSFRKSSQLGTSRITYWNHQLDSLYQNLANGNCPWLWEAGSFFRVSPQSRSPFSASLQTFFLTARAYLNTQKYGLFCRLIELCRPGVFDSW